MYIGEQPVTFGCPLPVPARDFKKLRLVPANSKVGLPGPARWQQRAARGPNFRKNPAFCRKKKLKFIIEKMYRFWVFSLNIISS
jgi:hypothetical protein